MAMTNYLLLSLGVILDGCSDTPGSHPSQLRLLILQLLHERRPQPQDFEVVRIVYIFNKLLEVIEGGELIAERNISRGNGVHRGAHKLGIRGASQKGGKGFRVLHRVRRCRSSREQCWGGRTILLAEAESAGGLPPGTLEFSMPHLRSLFIPGSMIAGVAAGWGWVLFKLHHRSC